VLAELVVALWDDKVSSLIARTLYGRVRVLFSDCVHMSNIGRYCIGLAHYAVLFGRSPESAFVPTVTAQETGRSLQTMAWQFTSSYGQKANSAASRMSNDHVGGCRPCLCRLSAGCRVPLLSSLKRRLDTYHCLREHTDTNDPTPQEAAAVMMVSCTIFDRRST
jgi:hypothetical protein